MASATTWSRDPMGTVRGVQQPMAAHPQMHRTAVAHMQAAQAHMQAGLQAAQAGLQAAQAQMHADLIPPRPAGPAPQPMAAQRQTQPAAAATPRTGAPAPVSARPPIVQQAAPQPLPLAQPQPQPQPQVSARAQPAHPTRWYTASPQQDPRTRVAAPEMQSATVPVDLHSTLHRSNARTPAPPGPSVRLLPPQSASRTARAGAGALPSGDGSEKVEGLRNLLEAAKLHGYLEAAEAWCERVGAVELMEVMEEVDSLAEALGLKMMEKRRLKKAAEQGSTAKLPTSGSLELQSPTSAGRMRPSLAAERTDSPNSTADCLTTTLMPVKAAVTPNSRCRANSIEPSSGRPTRTIEVHVEQVDRSGSPASAEVRFQLPPTAPALLQGDEAQPQVPGLALGRLTSSRSMEPLDSPAAKMETASWTPCSGSRSATGLRMDQGTITEENDMHPERVVPPGMERSPKSGRTAGRANRTQSQPAPRTCSHNSLSLKSRRGSRERLPKYGLDAELEAKAQAKYDNDLEEDAALWVQDITGIQVTGDFFGMLKTGEVLCQLVNVIRPGSVAKVNASGMPFRERENISNFLKACRSLGVQEYALFSTDDLYDENNLMSVVKCLHALGGTVQRTVPEFSGPHLGVADTSNAKKDSKREIKPVTQTGGIHCALGRVHVDKTTHHQIVRGGC